MCGRFTLRTRLDRIFAELAASVAEEYADELLWKPRYNVAPTQNILAVRNVAGERKLAPLRWGLIPSWAKDKKIGASLMNARGETVAEKPSFRAAFKRRRCLIPADGFYEWQKTTNSRVKTPYFITVGEEAIFTFAGLWETWKAEDGTTLETCTIITTTPNELMQTLHDRMPVILPPAARETWLDPQQTPELLQTLLVPYDTTKMHNRPVSTYVNNATHEGPECLAE